MAQNIKQGDIFGRIGSGIGKGLSEQLPEEVTRGRLSAGLKILSEQKDLSPFQQFSYLASIPGVTPQMIQSGTDLLRQQARGQALADFQAKQQQPQPSPFPNTQSIKQSGSKVPSITQEQPLQQIQEGFVPPTKEQEFSRAGELYNENPARFGNDPQKALDFVESETQRNQAINEAYAKKHSNLSNIQDNVVKRLNEQSQRLNTQIPSELYSKIEDDAIQATKSKKEGGRGLTEQQAMKEYGEELNKASKEWSKIPTWGSWGITQKSANETLRAMKTTQETMEKLGITDLFAQQMQKDNQISPKLAFAIAEPVSRVPQLSKQIQSIPDISIKTRFNPPSAIEETLKVSENLGKFLSDHAKASPLAIAYELEKRGYDPNTWLQWVTDNSKNLNLRQKQIEQLEIPLQHFSPMADWWLQSFSGVQ